jgi:predicted ArsR family transcriptional regulator
MSDLHRALADPTRQRILAWLEAGGATATVDEVAAAAGVHRTVAFEHLELLADSGLVERSSRSGFRGRPARTYRTARDAAEISYPARQHRLLATLLAGAIDRGVEPRQFAEAYGGQLAAGSRSEAEAIGRLQPLGGRYELSGDRIAARICVFHEACDSARQVVCGVQAGMLEGALAAAGVEQAVIPEGPDGRGGCRFQVRGRGEDQLPDSTAQLEDG